MLMGGSKTLLTPRPAEPRYYGWAAAQSGTAAEPNPRRTGVRPGLLDSKTGLDCTTGAASDRGEAQLRSCWPWLPRDIFGSSIRRWCLAVGDKSCHFWQK